MTDAKGSKANTSPLGLYPIREVAEKTGVNPITLRAWERRYGLVKPHRTPKGHRLYSEEDIQLIQRVVRLLETGIPVSRVRAALEQPQTTEVPPLTGQDWERHAEALVKASLAFSPGALDAAYREACNLYPSVLLVRQVLRPALERLRRLEGREPQAIHGTSMLRRYLTVQLGHHLWQQTLRNQGPAILFGCLPGDDNDLNSAFLGLLLVERDFRVIWVPDTTPLLYLGESAEICGAAAVLLCANSTPSRRLLTQELPILARNISVPVMVAGEASARHATDFRKAGIAPLPLDKEALLSQLRDCLPRFNQQETKHDE
ncbi:MAG: MerR family transcriptional regulator [Methylohalobius crimeensis]